MIMRGLQSTAPEIYEAMVVERDIYMGRGLDEMGANIKDKSVENTVAVVVRDDGWMDGVVPYSHDFLIHHVLLTFICERSHLPLLISNRGWLMWMESKHIWLRKDGKR